MKEIIITIPVAIALILLGMVIVEFSHIQNETSMFYDYDVEIKEFCMEETESNQEYMMCMFYWHNAAKVDIVDINNKGDKQIIGG